MGRLLVTVWPEGQGWRVDDGVVSEFYSGRAAAVARAEMLADEHTAAGRQLQIAMMAPEREGRRPAP
ncbi:MAG: hypothetical protein JWO33_144 [Caulobacteraceae bacterium]|nr:hypothetical protein [Caulobacteraceae bacterium]